MKRTQAGEATGLFQEELLWKAVRDRDRSWDGKFYVGVMTTGIYCRPSCPSRPALRRNVRFFSTPEAAERAGLRACLRCHPKTAGGPHPDTERIRDVCDYVRRNAAEPLSLAGLAERAGLSPFHFHRTFKAIVGVTPKQFLDACRVGAWKGQLRTNRSVTDASFEAGFSSLSRAYERADTRLGMTPAQYRRGGEGLTISYAAVDGPLGRMMIGATDRGLCFLQFAERDEELLAMLRAEYPAARIEPMPEPFSHDFDQWMEALREHLAGQRRVLELPLDLRATAFQMQVWRYLQGIPYGAVQSYREVAEGLGRPKAARAVARACACNRVALVIPCHRVIRGTGELGGYRWGLDRKRALIDRERSVASRKG
ncbi:MAG: bifunctional DNA-binding transcriptional regulator/O6-methylguanine-DNA methyltransferase Ada [Bryobacterales bacterium]|nr:bifunctional DNA-binding transcriptional regulator/O6-methylguanine-DNA methyltransferase Ada [Bryobacterales bacterium]